MSIDKNVGVIGLGVMGSRMASNLVRAGYGVVVYNRSPGPVQELVREGATAAASPKEVGERCSIVVLALLDSNAVESVVMGENGLSRGMPSGGVVVDTSTIDPATAVNLAGQLRRKGVSFLDAPVSGGPEGAQAGTLAIMVGGDRAGFERAKEVISKIGKNVFYLGESGSGLRMKLFNQALVGVYFTGIAEAYAWANKTGLRIEDLQKVISLSWGDSPVFRHFAATVISDEKKKGASMRNLKKDLDIILQSAKKDGAELTLAQLADLYLTKAVERGYAESEISTLWSILDQVRPMRS